MQMIRSTNFQQFVDFASPAFFDVMPTRSLVGEAKKLVGAYRDRDGFRGAIDGRRRELNAAGIDVRLVAPDDRDIPPKLDAQQLTDDERREIGGRILQVYFHQLLSRAPTLLDLSRQRWMTADGRLVWQPGRGHEDWDENFRTAMAEVYTSFYTGSEDDLRAALRKIDLEPTTDLFLEHFGAGDQSNVEFRVQHFTRSFHQVFVRCKEQKIRLDRGFLPLGIYLATLYQTLEALEVPMDVRGAFNAARAGTTGA